MPNPSHEDDGVYVSLETLMARRHLAQGVDVFKPQLSRSMLLGDVRSRFRGRGMELEEVRQYLPGDDIRSIDWRVSARLGSTHTKLFAEERERPVHILVDQRVSMFFGSSGLFKSVMAAELAAIISWAALVGSDRIGGQVFGDTDQSFVKAKRTRQAVMHLLREIARFNNALPGSSVRGHAQANDDATGDSASAITLDSALTECKRVTRPGTAVFVLSDFADFTSTTAKLLVSMGRHMDLSLMRVVDSLEEKLEITGRVGVSDGLKTESVVVSDALRERYLEARNDTSESLKTTAVKARATLLNVSTDDNPATTVSRLYRS